MKISELTPAEAATRGMRLPAAVAGETRSITLGQIIDAAAAAIVPFDGIDDTAYIFGQTALGPTTEDLPIVYRPQEGRFYARRISPGPQAVFYPAWPGSERYQTDGGPAPRADCLYIDPSGRLYRHDGTDLVRAGLTPAEARIIDLATPVEVADEATLRAMAQAGELDEGRIYYVAEQD